MSQTLPTEHSSNHTPTVAIETQGCKLNQADTNMIAWQFIKSGFRIVPTSEPTDVYVVNSCTVTHVADRKARHSLRSARRRNPNATIVATGCYAQRSPQELNKLTEVDLVISNIEKPHLVKQILDLDSDTPISRVIGDDIDPIVLSHLRTRAMVKIQEGCNQVCAYCIVPKVRGRERSIPPKTIIENINTHISHGYKEVVLTGTQLGSYGFDLSHMDLTKLIEQILSNTDVTRLRVSSLQPQEINSRLIQLWANQRLCPHFHVPLQSGNNNILKRMRRRYTPQLYSKVVGQIRNHIPDVSITTDVIVGFPGETDDDFKETFELCENTEFADIHVFPYSVRPGTSAVYLPKHIPTKVISKRVEVLLDLAHDQSSNFQRSFIGKTRKVLWENTKTINGSTYWSGLTDNYIRVFSNNVGISENMITLAKLESVTNDILYAHAIQT